MNFDGIRKKMLIENSEKNMLSKFEAENNLYKAKTEIRNLNAELRRLSYENQKISRAKENLEYDLQRVTAAKKLTSFILLLVIIISLVFCYNFYTKYIALRSELDGIKNEVSDLREKSERKSKVENILSALDSDNVSRFFYNSKSLVYVDSLKNFYPTDKFTDEGAKNVVAGNLSSTSPLNFCREYSNSNSLYAFFDPEGLKAAIKSLNVNGGVSVRSDKRFTFPTNSASWTQKINLLEKYAFFSAQTLKPSSGSSINDIADKIFDALKINPDDSVYRFFFGTAQKDLYVVSIVQENRFLGSYLVSTSEPVKRYPIIRELQDTIKQRTFNSNEAEFEISLRNSDGRLNNDTDFDTCLDIYISQLITKGE